MTVPRKSYADQITDLIANRPGIRNAEIADELNLWAADVRPMIQSRIENSRIIVDKVQGITGLINAYRINPKWTPEDAKFVPSKRDREDDPIDDVPEPAQRRLGRPPGVKNKAKPKKAVATPPKLQESPSRTLAPFDWAKSAPDAESNKEFQPPQIEASQFSCAVYDDGSLRIESGADIVVLSPEQAARAYKHLSRFHAKVTP